MDLARAFRILDIPLDSDAAAIKSAWRKLVRGYHPDLAKTDPEGANKRLVEINAAFDAVSNCSAADLTALRKTQRHSTRASHSYRAFRERARRKQERASAAETMEPGVSRSRKQKAPDEEKQSATSLMARVATGQHGGSERGKAVQCLAASAFGFQRHAQEKIRAAQEGFRLAKRCCGREVLATKTPVYL